MFRISNNNIAVEVDDLGAEITSMVCHGRQLIWHADPAFWRRHAPILFPIVGKVCDNTYRVGNDTYHLPQHGFARDSRFRVVDASDSSISLILESDAESLKVYPYNFQLQVCYSLVEGGVSCEWTVRNTGNGLMYYQIGAHPAFVYPDYSPEDALHGYLQLWREGVAVDSLEVTRLSARGHALPDTYRLPLTAGHLPITQTLFANDALVLEGAQTDAAVLYDKGGKAFVRMSFDAPVLGIWSPVNAPFCCIEPWYGRTDSEGFEGTIDQRPYIQTLAPKESKVFGYQIEAMCDD